ncbi:MAG: C_GCAxxG_C_C family protein [Desulfovibrio sp.]|nr:C_GCAxxG_C_C family protein [Desulfovibrio sp.]
MDALLFELLPHIRQGHNCAQLLHILAQQASGEENASLLRAVRGLGHGIGHSGGPCGLLSGGATVLAWLASPDASEPHPMLDAMLNDYASWFMERTQRSGISCDAIVQDLAAAAGQNVQNNDKPPLELCGDLLSQCWARILELAEAYQLERLGY